MGVFYGDCSLGEGVMIASLPLDRSLVARPKRALQTLAGAPNTPPSLHASPAPCTQLDKTVIVRLKGLTFTVFSYTRVRQYSPIGIIGK